LCDFHEAHGHSVVPRNLKGGLGRWVQDQRREYKRFSNGKKTTMTDERLAQFNDLDFVFQINGRTKSRQVMASIRKTGGAEESSDSEESSSSSEE
jgi:hypothetical protein